MPPADGAPLARWHAKLELGFERRGARSVLARRRHDGPLVVQKALYPEGDGVCHAIVVHPPAGIVGGDQLELDIHAGDGAAALLTTPGATKWYRSPAAWASQHVRLEAGPASVVEWLPQETIFFDGSRAQVSWHASLAEDARIVAWEIFCLGRSGSGERFDRGECRIETRLDRGDRLVFLERARVGPDSCMAASAAGLAGCTVFGTMLVAAPAIEDAWLAACREQQPLRGEAGVTRMPGILVARYRGDSGEAARAYFNSIWHRLREPVLARAAVDPRIWRT